MCLTGKGAIVSYQQAKSRGTNQFDKRYFRQSWFVCLSFHALSSLSLVVVALLDEVEFEHFADGGRRHIPTRDQQCDRCRDSLFGNPLGGYISAAVPHPPIGLGSSLLEGNKRCHSRRLRSTLRTQIPSGERRPD